MLQDSTTGSESLIGRKRLPRLQLELQGYDKDKMFKPPSHLNLLSEKQNKAMSLFCATTDCEQKDLAPQLNCSSAFPTLLGSISTQRQRQCN